MSLINEGDIKTYSDEGKLYKFLTSKSTYKKWLEEFPK